MTVTKVSELGGRREKRQVRICSAEGEAKIVPDTAADKRPVPTKPEKEGSWPAPPPETRWTRWEEDLEEGRR